MDAASVLIQKADSLLKGDLPGHPFRGNQWTGGGSSSPIKPISVHSGDKYGGSGTYGGKVITSSARQPGVFQVTSFDENETPTGHNEYDSLGEAMIPFRDRIVDLPRNLSHSEPDDVKHLQAARKSPLGPDIKGKEYIYLSRMRPLSGLFDPRDKKNVLAHGVGHVGVLFRSEPLPYDEVIGKELSPASKDALADALEAWARSRK